MVGLIFTGGIARLLHHPLNWTIDLSTCFFAWACFLSADIAWRRDTLMSFELLTTSVPAGMRRAILYVNYTLITAFLVYLIYSGAWLAYVSSARSFQGSASPSSPRLAAATQSASLNFGSVQF